MVRSFFLAFVFSIIALSSLVYAEGQYTSISIDSYSISYDNATNLFVYPLEHSMDRIIHLKNTGKDNISIKFDVRTVVGGKDYEVQFWPQPSPSYLVPGDSRDFVMKVEWFSDITKEWEEGKTYQYLFNAEIHVNGEPLNITLKNSVFVEKVPGHVQEIETNSNISGTVYDTVTNEPIADAEVVVWSNGPRVEYKTKTNSSGSFSVPVRAYQRNFLKNYIQYSIRISKNGYDEYNYAVSPSAGSGTTTRIGMVRQTESANYTLVNKIYTELPPARVDFSEDHMFFATVPFHSSESIDFIKDHAYLCFFSSNGTLLWRYKLDNEIPTVDVSDDGNMVATAHRPSSDRWNGGDYIMLFDRSGNLTWTYRIPGIGDWSLPGYVMEPGYLEDGISEVRISHDSRYIAAGTWAGKFYLIDLAKRKVSWGTDLNDGQVRFILFKEDDSSVYVGSDPYMFNYALNGTLNWKAFIGSWPYNMVISKNYVFVGPKVGRFVSLFDKNTGAVIWRYPIDARPDNLLISPDESFFAYQSSNGELAISNAFFNSSGDLMFNLKSANGGYVTDDSNYIAYYGSDSVHLANRNGNEMWSFMLDPVKWPAPRGSVYISGDKKKIIVADAMNGYVYFFEGGIEQINDTGTHPFQPTGTDNHDNEPPPAQKSLWQMIVEWFQGLFG